MLTYSDMLDKMPRKASRYKYAHVFFTFPIKLSSLSNCKQINLECM